jgi:hypothetical protein
VIAVEDVDLLMRLQRRREDEPASLSGELTDARPTARLKPVPDRKSCVLT